MTAMTAANQCLQSRGDNHLANYTQPGRFISF